MSDQELTFAQTIKRIEEIVALLERGDAQLEQSLALFEEGTALIRSAGRMLDNAEQKVVRLVKSEDGTPAEADFLEESV
ncbi:MAG: exodeoxyribonuclease VII small subunit [Clostridiales bacterium]|jgi:exodeoxyribonuclease VII small subunit|nr:exodeoxyribonuclease VII small subunit [Clostridiales bacterium]